MSSKPSFKQQQVDFAAHIRDPEANQKPEGIEDRRMAIYRDLFINSIASLLAGSFPVIRSLYDDAQWVEFVRGFFRKEHNKTPHFPEIPREFVTYLKNSPNNPEKPFLYELAHYEWLELHLEKHSLEIVQRSDITAEQFLDGIPMVSPLVRLQAYSYPVHQIKREQQPTTASAQPVCLVVWRDLLDQVQFAELNPFSALLLEQLINNKTQTGRELLEVLATAHQHPDISQFVDFGTQTLMRWYQQHILLDSIRTT